MFARRMAFTFKLECIDDAVKLFRTSVVPGAKKQRGFRGACLLTDRKTGKATAVTFWQAEADALANEENLFFQNQLVKFMPYFAGPPIREGYSVSVHQFGGGPRAKRRGPRKKTK